MCMLDHDPPIVFSIVPDSSNAIHFSKFCFKHAFFYLRTGDCVFYDNLNYHVAGWAAENLKILFDARQIHLIPKYSPELNPAELVFSQLKRILMEIDNTTPLLPAICNGLAKISLKHVVGYYIRRYYFQ